MYGVEALTERNGSIGSLRDGTRGAVPACSVGMVRTVPDLAAMVAKARADFGVRCFWNTPVLADPVDDARLVAGKLRHYGGRRGWAVAIGIDRALREASGAFDGVDPVPARGVASSRGQQVA